MDAFFAMLAEGFDLPILDWIQANLTNGFFDFIMPIITLLGDAGIFWIACSVVLMFFPQHRKTGLSMAISLLIGLVVCNMTLKPLCHRIRPYDYQMQVFHREITLLIEAQHDFAFPSGHTIASFEACTALMIRNKKLGVPATVLACLIAFSRLYLYVHYPTDVIASIFLGIGIAYLGCWIADKLAQKFPQLKLN